MVTIPTGTSAFPSADWWKALGASIDAADAAVLAEAKVGTALSTSDSLDELTAGGNYLIPSNGVAAAVGAPVAALGMVRVTESGYSGPNGPIVEHVFWAYTTNTTYRRIRNSLGRWTPWKAFRPMDVASRRREVLLSEFRARRGGSIGTGGRAAVALRFDHHTKDFAAKVIPLLKKYRLPWSLALNPQNVGTGDDTMTYSQIEAEAIAGGGEVWNHGGNHKDYSDDNLLDSQVVGSLQSLQSGLPRLPIEGWNMPGVGGTGLGGLNLGRSAAEWDSYAGSLIMSQHAVNDGAAGGVYFPLKGEPVAGYGHYTMDLQTDSTVKGLVNGAIAAKAGLVLMLHPSLLDSAGGMTTAQLDSVLGYLAQCRDDGSLAVLSQSGLTLADVRTNERHNLLPGLLTGTHGWTGWTVNSEGIARWTSNTSTAPFTRTISIAREGHFAGSTRELVIYARASSSRTVTIRVQDGTSESTTTHGLSGTGSWQRITRPYTVPLDATSITVSITGSSAMDIVRVDALAI